MRIRALRKERGLTQEALAEGIGRSVEAVSNLERGKSLPSFETLSRLARLLEVPVRDFFDFGGDRALRDPERSQLIATLMRIANGLDGRDLAVAVDQIRVLARRRDPAQR